MSHPAHKNIFLRKKILRCAQDDVSSLFLMSVLSQTLLALVGSHFALFSFLSAWHSF